MKEEKNTNTIYGLSRIEEEKQLADIIQVADDNLEWTKQHYEGLAEQLRDQLQIYDTNDKEGLALWYNTQSQFIMAHLSRQKNSNFIMNPILG